jgi:hypothetical protein
MPVTLMSLADAHRQILKSTFSSRRAKSDERTTSASGGKLGFNSRAALIRYFAACDC